MSLFFPIDKNWTENKTISRNFCPYKIIDESHWNISGDDGDMVTQEDTIFVQGMNPQTDEDEIAKHFGAIGIIKVRSKLF